MNSLMHRSVTLCVTARPLPYPSPSTLAGLAIKDSKLLSRRSRIKRFRMQVEPAIKYLRSLRPVHADRDTRLFVCNWSLGLSTCYHFGVITNCFCARFLMGEMAASVAMFKWDEFANS